MIKLDLFPSNVWICENFLQGHRSKFLDYLDSKNLEHNLDNNKIEVGIDLKDPNFSAFHFLINEQIKKVVPDNLSTRLKISTAWANYSGKNSTMGRHDHIRTLPNVCVYTASYYPNFISGMGNIRMHDSNRFNYLINDYSNRYYDIELKQDMLVIFPSWLDHEVLPNTTDTVRISFIVDFSLT